MIGSTTDLLSVKNFCIYTGISILFCYIANATIFGACLTLHGRRVFSRRHTLTCLPVSKSRDDLQAERGACYALICSGEIPTRPSHDQSICEKGPQAALTKVLLLTPVRVVVLLVFAVYLGVAIWGCTRLQQGLDLKNLLLPSSYYYEYLVWSKQYFGNWLIISFVTTVPTEYSSPEALQLLDSNDEVDVMEGTRAIADASPANVFAFAPVFVMVEQYVTILPGTLKTVGFTLAGQWH
ncbi:patched domain-containing protein 3 [Elysia marginata]|uniref:Patched domain-containing protein 3 n=1 Tax=Elysia marginata TaxID=1093978 RepID=A0AAV4EPS1_9GAST|nr:patched domain-containing protein 3 [Elysia marginata]